MGLPNSVIAKFEENSVDGYVLSQLPVANDESLFDLGLIRLDDYKFQVALTAIRRNLCQLVRVLLKLHQRRHYKINARITTSRSIDRDEKTSICIPSCQTVQPFIVNYDDVQLQSLIGEGGYGKVYKGKYFHRDVAVKVFNFATTYVDDEEKKEKDDNYESIRILNLPRDFYSELNTLTRLRHPNVTLLLGICLEPRYSIITEFVPCGSLFDLLHRHQALPNWTVSRIVSVAREICFGLRYLHKNSILHCDLKSSNILITESWDVKICDFGLSYFYGESTTNYTTDLFDEESSTVNPNFLYQTSTIKAPLGCVGTHHWMAPEVLRGEEYSASADVYSFGVILWEMVCRQIPYHGLSSNQVTALVGFGLRLPVPPGDYSICPKPLHKIICLTLRPDNRIGICQISKRISQLHQMAIIDVEENLDNFFSTPFENARIVSGDYLNNNHLPRNTNSVVDEI